MVDQNSELSCYVEPLSKPKNAQDGLANFIQMIINAAVRGDIREAVLLAVDLKHDIECGSYADVVDEKMNQAVINEVAAMRETMQREMQAAVAMARAEGASAARADMLRRLQD